MPETSPTTASDSPITASDSVTLKADAAEARTPEADAPEADAAEKRATETAFWDALYNDSDRVWSGLPNHALVREAGGLTPGRALDLGCGEGADAIWLALEGWQVTGVDISRTALDRAERHAADKGVDGDRIDWQRHDLATSFPAGPFDLVSAHFLHSPGDLPREAVLRRAAATVAPGGVLLVVGHAGWPAWAVDPDHDVHFPTPQEVFAALELPEEEWELLVSETYERPAARPDGTMGTRRDNTLKVRRLRTGG
ncbi:class I SAM-dependent methyltransferase [Streptomyces sp. NA04227]|uniref:class I SAM-dependent methyltransferase n=1 Tax=Streptomyces sp. NA04227 TaxID=2742136 RepID=UPI0015916A7A|nr:class I SAM-dependent methyltransferase [Streptomyces sp. NA04227]QKW08345.1 class I SAM-dependent methyltransferase [Streptomyces sp. NA04227]